MSFAKLLSLWETNTSPQTIRKVFWAGFSWPWNLTPPAQIMNWPQWPITLWQNITHYLSSGKAMTKLLKWDITHCSVLWGEMLWFKDRTRSTLLQVEQVSSRRLVGQDPAALELAILSLIASRPWTVALDGQGKTHFLFVESVLQCLSCAMAKRGLCCSKLYDYISHGLSGSSDDIGWIAFIGTSWIVRISQL